jgi:hypothetical protein
MSFRLAKNLVIYFCVVIFFIGCTADELYNDPRMNQIPYEHRKFATAVVDIHIDSISLSDMNLTNKKFTVLSGNQGMEEGDLEFQEVARYVKNAMILRGAKISSNQDNSDLIIRVSFGIGDPSSTVAYSYWTGWVQHNVHSTVYKRTLIIAAYDAKNPKQQLWKTMVTSVGTTSNLRNVVPSLVATSVWFLGKNAITDRHYVNLPTLIRVELGP